MAKYLFFFAVFLLTCSVQAQQQLNQAEYFWDTDPGQGNGSVLNAADGSLDEMSESLIASNLNIPAAAGLHRLGIRVRESNNQWSAVHYAMVVVSSAPTVTTPTVGLIQAEYFWDTDPGQGNGQALFSTDGAMNEIAEALFEQNVMTPAVGLHKLGVRTKDTSGNWSSVFYAVVSVANVPAAASGNLQLTQAEYFWDTDPGNGNGQAVFAVDGAVNGISEALQRAASTSSVSLGAHVLYTRVKDNSGNWGPKFGSIVIVDTSLVPVVNSVSGNQNLCSNALPDTVAYTALVFGADTYNWSISGGSIYSGQGTASVNVIWNAGGPWALYVQGCNVNGCGNTDSLIPQVTNVSAVSFSGLNASYCNYDAAVMLTPSVSGGTFSGPGVSGIAFYPSQVSGMAVVYYTYSSNGCTATSSDTCFVTAVSGLSYSGLNAQYCATDTASLLTPSISGGIFSGPGVSGNLFDPSLANDTSQVTYFYTQNGCNYTTSAVAYVGTPFTVSISGLDSVYCSTDPADLISASVPGGIFSGAGMSGNSFNPAALSGTVLVSYVVVQNGCTASVSDSAMVVAAPPVPLISNSSDTLFCSVAASSYQWMDCANGNAIIAGATAQTFVAPGPGSYAVQITSGSCSNSSACFVLNTTAFADNVLAMEQSLLVFPNPNNGNFTVSGLPAEKCCLLDAAGRQIVEFVPDAKGRYSFKSLADGIYYLQANGRTGLNYLKVIVLH